LFCPVQVVVVVVGAVVVVVDVVELEPVRRRW